MARESKLSVLAVVLGLVLFIGAGTVGGGYVAYQRWCDTPHGSYWNARYSEPTFPLDDNPETKPEPRMWATR